MIYQFKRNGKLIGDIVPLDTPPIYSGTILVHELVVRCPLYDGEALAVSYSTATGIAITYSQIFQSRDTSDGSKEYYALLPNKVLTAGDKKASVYILDLYEPEHNDNGVQYRVITSADIPFSVYPSSINTDFEPIDESVSQALQAKINALLKPPDIAEANLNGEASVVIRRDGRLKFSYLKGLDGKDGINGKDGKDGKDGINGINGINGKDGINGINGINGKDGKDGINGVISTCPIDFNGFAFTVNENGELLLHYSDEQTPPEICINENGELIIQI